ncbi:hypothetical protein GCM10009828_058090 [Actinoplanes couchii]|uniref:Uncharacterized protein n=1 Tax=Actinoplanes couchii TaxID=403638 RepID=A0ABQ3XT64_9ACTN|nr:hypothetical protein Aco03nite_101110 [Actinoplanes couchii]
MTVQVTAGTEPLSRQRTSGTGVAVMAAANVQQTQSFLVAVTARCRDVVGSQNCPGGMDRVQCIRFAASPLASSGPTATSTGPSGGAWTGQQALLALAPPASR